jgi:DNA-binding transcriptional regulator YiaG
MKKMYRSKLHGALHRMAVDLYSVAAIDMPTMQRFDESCLNPNWKAPR